MAFNRSAHNNFKPRSIRIKNRVSGDVLEGVLVNEENIDGKNFFVIRFINGAVNKFNKEAYTVLSSR